MSHSLVFDRWVFSAIFYGWFVSYHPPYGPGKACRERERERRGRAITGGLYGHLRKGKGRRERRESEKEGEVNEKQEGRKGKKEGKKKTEGRERRGN